MSRRGKRKTLLSSDPLSASYYVQDELWSPSTMTSTTTTTTSTTTTTAATTTSTKSDIDICLQSFIEEAEEDFVYFNRLTGLSATSRRAIFLDNEDEICCIDAAPRLCRTINLVRETIDLTSLEKNPPKWRWQSSAAGHHKSNLPLSTTVDITKNILDGQKKGGKYYIRRDSSTRHYHKRKKRKTVKMFQPIGRQLMSKYLAKNRIRKVIFRYIYRNIKYDAHIFIDRGWSRCSK